MIGSNLKKFRQQKGLTQKDLADILGVSRQAVCLWEAGKREVRVGFLSLLADILGITVDELVRCGSATGFQYLSVSAVEVGLVGDFNHWAKPLPLKNEGNGLWRITLDLKPGRYEYKFYVDGEWCLDPENGQTVSNRYGTQNSVVTV
ncbi:MAG: helix-turn-helix domain-containing protein [Candidatus Omnitrophota bacterium]